MYARKGIVVASAAAWRRHMLVANHPRTAVTGVETTSQHKRAPSEEHLPPLKGRPNEHRFKSTMTVAHLLESRNNVVHSITKDTVVLDAIKLMVKHNIGSLVVVSKDNKAQSVVSERDYLEKVVLRGRTSANTKVEEIMSEKSLVTVRPDSTLTECMELMTANRVRHIPVVSADLTPVGMVSIGDTVKALVDSYRSDAAHMEDFISGNTY